MGKFDDFYKEYGANNPDFIEFEEIYSDTRARDAAESYNRRTERRQPSDRRVTERDPYGRGAEYRRPADMRNGYDNQRSRYNGAYGAGPDRRGYGSDGYRTVDRDPYGGRPDRPTGGYQRPLSVQQKRRMPRKTRRALIVAVFAVVLIVLISGIVAIAVSSSGIGTVTSLTVTETGSDQVVLNWKKVNGAEGYRVRMAVGGTEDYQDCMSVDGADNTEAVVTGLDQASTYSFSVSAFSGDKESGKPAVTELVSTLPAPPSITNTFSAKAGAIHVDWTGNDKASGYVVEYKKDGGSYSDDATVTVSDPAECRADISGLDVNSSYTVRVYAYLSGDKQLNSLPSQEVSVKVVAEDTEVIPKAMEQQVDSSIDPDKPMIALTFDDGPAVNGDSSERILDVLEQYGAKATFFMVGYYAGENPDNVKRKQSLGMELGNHTWDHSHYGDEVSPEDIRRASNKVYDICGQYPTAFRSPGGMTTQTILNECQTEGISAYYWSIDTQDWNSRNADSVYHEVMDYVKDGDIILMHEIYDSTADAVERMVPELIAQGYQLVTCHDLIKCKTGSDPVPGTQYVDGTRTMDP